MIKMKRVICIFLSCVLLAAFAPLVHAQEDVLIAQASASYTIPAAGEAFSFDAVTVPDDAHYAAEIMHVYFSSLQGDELENGFIVERGSTYFVCIRFVAESGYRIDLTETSFNVNDQPADVDETLQMPVVSFTVSGGLGDRPLGGLDPTELMPLFALIIDRYPVLNALTYVIFAVAYPFILIREACTWTVALFSSLWDRIFHRNTADAV